MTVLVGCRGSRGALTTRSLRPMRRYTVLDADVLGLGELVTGPERVLKIVLDLLVRVPLDLMV